MDKVKKQIIFNQTHIDIIDEMIVNNPGIDTLSDAVRYAILMIADQSDHSKQYDEMSKKINFMSKEISIITEMVAGSFHEQGIKAIEQSNATYVYKDARKRVEEEINRFSTIKSNPKKNSKEQQLKKEQLTKKEGKKEGKVPNTFSRNFR